jgi:hypothetical protein
LILIELTKLISELMYDLPNCRKNNSYSVFEIRSGRDDDDDDDDGNDDSFVNDLLEDLPEDDEGHRQKFSSLSSLMFDSSMLKSMDNRKVN